MATLYVPNAPRASTIANEAIASGVNFVSTEVADDVALAEDGRDPTEEASVDVAEASDFQDLPSRIVPSASFVVDKGVCSFYRCRCSYKSRR